MTNKYHIVKKAIRALYDVKRPLFATLFHSCNFFFQIPYRMKESPSPSPLMTRRLEAQTFLYRKKRNRSARARDHLLIEPSLKQPRSRSQPRPFQWQHTLQIGTRESSR